MNELIERVLGEHRPREFGCRCGAAIPEPEVGWNLAWDAHVASEIRAALLADPQVMVEALKAEGDAASLSAFRAYAEPHIADSGAVGTLARALVTILDCCTVILPVLPSHTGEPK